MDEVIVTLISIGIPSTVTLITHILDRRFATKSDTRQVILQMILEDRFYWRDEHKLPLNWQHIQDEYAKYAKAGGNGEISKKVHEYNDWYKTIEDKLKNSADNL